MPVSEDFKDHIAQCIKEKEGFLPNEIDVTVTHPESGGSDIFYDGKEPFQRVRRITGYLTGDLNSWNNAKRAEERDRVKHDIDETPEDNPALGDPDDQPASNDEALAFADEPVDVLGNCS